LILYRFDINSLARDPLAIGDEIHSLDVNNAKDIARYDLQDSRAAAAPIDAALP